MSKAEQDSRTGSQTQQTTKKQVSTPPSKGWLSSSSSSTPLSRRSLSPPPPTTRGGRGRLLSPPPPSRVSLLQGRLLRKAHSDLQSPTIVQRALLMGNRALTRPTSSSNPNLTPSPSNSKTGAKGGISAESKSRATLPPPPPSGKKVVTTTPAATTTSTQVKVQLSRSSPVSKIREILTATTTTLSSNGSSSKKSPPKVHKSKSSSSPHPQKPPRKAKDSPNGDKDKKGSSSPRNGVSKKSGGSRRSPPTPSGVGLSIGPSRHTPTESPKPPPPTPVQDKEQPPLAEAGIKGSSPRYTVRQRPLAPPAPLPLPHPPVETSKPGFKGGRSLKCPPYGGGGLTHYRSLPSLTPHLLRVTQSTFLLQAPRPTKTSLMRHLISNSPPNSSSSFKDSTYTTSASAVALFTPPNPPVGCGPLLPRSKRRRSVSCLNLRDYASYVLALRSTSSSHSSPRFSRLRGLYSSLDKLLQLEASSASLPPTLPEARALDFESWWRVRHRNRMETEMDSLSRELHAAQRDGEFFFRPKTPPIWMPDSHLRFKKWRVSELREFLTCPDRSRAALWTLDLYKTGWRGMSVKEQAERVEIMEAHPQRRRRSPSPTRNSLLLRRSFSMSSTLSLEQREGIKRRIGGLISAARRGGEEEEGVVKRSRFHWLGGKSAVTSRMGFTLSSDPKKATPPAKVGLDAYSGLSETRKKEISHQISAEVKERKRRGVVGGEGGGAKSFGLRKATSFTGVGGVKRSPPIYSRYVNHPVGERVRVFEEQVVETTPSGRSKESTSLKATPPVFTEIQPPLHKSTIKGGGGARQGRTVHIVTPVRPLRGGGGGGGNGEEEESTSSSLPPLPFRSRSPLLRSPSPPPRPFSSPPLPPPPREYVSHINVISKLAELLLRRNTSLKQLVTREVLERDRLERLRSLNCGEVERLREYFEDRGSWEDLRNTEDVNLLRVLFCSDSNLAKLAEVPQRHTHQLTRPRPDGSSPTPTTRPPLSPRSARELLHLNTRCRKPIYQPSSSPNVCQPTLTAHCYLRESVEGGLDEVGVWSNSSPSSLPHPCPPPLPRHMSPPPPPIIHTTSRQVGLNYTNYDPLSHQPRFRYIPPPPHIQQQPMLRRPTSAMGGGGGGGVWGRPVRRSESLHYKLGGSGYGGERTKTINKSQPPPQFYLDYGLV